VFSKILVCLDGSTLAEQILPLAETVALSNKSKVILIQVIPNPVTITTPSLPGVVPGPVVFDYVLKQREHEEAEAVKYLEKITHLMGEKGVNAEYITIIGNAGVEIVKYAATNKIDLIALATHGRSGFGHAVFGSVAYDVLRESGLPILLVKPAKIQDAGPVKPESDISS
jgi:nucleotide-binding universal stress UspA family protein